MSKETDKNERVDGSPGHMTDEEITAWHERWDAPSPNPELGGITPPELARRLLRTRKPLEDK